MDQKSDLIKEDIEETRSQLTEKLGTLESQLRGTVQSARDTVEDTIQNVKDSVKKFTPGYQIEEHPLLILGGSVAAGLLVGRLLQAPSANVPWTSGAGSLIVDPLYRYREHSGGRARSPGVGTELPPLFQRTPGADAVEQIQRDL